MLIGATGLTYSNDYLEEEQEDGTWTARISATCAWAGRAGFLPVLYSQSPYNAHLGLYRRTMARSKTGELCEMTLHYKGTTPDGNLPEAYGELIAARGQEPIQCHPDFKAVLAGMKAAPLHNAKWYEDDTFAKFPEYLSDGTTLNHLAGVSSYLVASITWRYHQYSFNEDYDISDLDTIDATPTGFTGTVPSGRDWLLVSKSCTRQGGIYHTTTDWLLSGPRGWDAEVYPD